MMQPTFICLYEVGSVDTSLEFVNHRFFSVLIRYDDSQNTCYNKILNNVCRGYKIFMYSRLQDGGAG